MKLHWISWIPAALVMVFIFIFSAQTAKESDGTSLVVAQKVYDIYEEVIKDEPPHSEEEVLKVINLFIRKAAHATEYGILSFLFAFHFWVLNKDKRQIFLLAVVFSFLYACSDEFHQLFVAGRSGQVTDVLIDTLGAIIGQVIFLPAAGLLGKVFKRKRAIQIDL